MSLALKTDQQLADEMRAAMSLLVMNGVELDKRGWDVSVGDDSIDGGWDYRIREDDQEGLKLFIKRTQSL